MFGSKLVKEDLNEVATQLNALTVQLSALNIMVDRVVLSQRDVQKDLKDTQKDVKGMHFYMDNKIKDELNTVERKYISFLEGKLVQFDQEANVLKGEKEATFRKMQENLLAIEA